MDEHAFPPTGFAVARLDRLLRLFVFGDSLTSERFTTRTKQLTKCCEPLQKMRVRLELSCGSISFVFWSRIFVLFEPCVRFHIFSSVWVTEWPPIGK